MGKRGLTKLFHVLSSAVWLATQHENRREIRGKEETDSRLPHFLCLLKGTPARSLPSRKGRGKGIMSRVKWGKLLHGQEKVRQKLPT